VFAKAGADVLAPARERGNERAEAGFSESISGWLRGNTRRRSWRICVAMHVEWQTVWRFAGRNVAAL